MYKYVFFDLDGTLTNPGEGITNSVAYSLEKFGIKEIENSSLKIYTIANLDCAHCASKIEKAISEIPEVEEVTLAFTTKKLRIKAVHSHKLFEKIQKLQQETNTLQNYYQTNYQTYEKKVKEIITQMTRLHNELLEVTATIEEKKQVLSTLTKPYIDTSINEITPKIENALDRLHLLITEIDTKATSIMALNNLKGDK